MHQAYIKTPVGYCLIEGDENGVSKIWAVNDDLPAVGAIVKLQPAPLLHKLF